ncbi:hypothetical protein N2152v2_008068 [Parachlorella kessleri]
MEAAGIHNFNLMTYTSILPPEAEEITFEEAQKYFHHGAVLECILAEIHGGRGDRVTAGVGRMMVRDRSTGAKKPMGGFAVEYEGHASEDVAEKQLDEALGRELNRREECEGHASEDLAQKQLDEAWDVELFDRRFTVNDHEHLERVFTIASQDITKAFGTAMAGICFVDYVTPVYHTGRPARTSEL